MQGTEEQMVQEPAKGGSVRCLTPIPRLSRPCVALHIAPRFTTNPLLFLRGYK